jgi:hypothetical protein
MKLGLVPGVKNILRMLESTVQWRTYGPMRENVTGEW